MCAYMEIHVTKQTNLGISEVCVCIYKMKYLTHTHLTFNANHILMQRANSFFILKVTLKSLEVNKK